MKRGSILLLLTLMWNSVPFSGTAHASGESQGQKDGGFTKHYEQSLFQVSHEGLYGVELVLTGRTFHVGGNALNIIVHDRHDRDVPGATVTVVPWMPEMDHGVKAEPRVMDRGGGLYSVANVQATMEGHWELRVTVAGPAGEDTAVFDFPLVKKPGDGEGGGQGHMHEMSPGMPPQEESGPATLISRRGLYRVTYVSTPEVPPLNRIHSWRLRVQTADGAPVTGAVVSVSGGMPAHGHGLPTEPEVTQELGGGVYVVSGMKFSMPGHWQVTFQIGRNGRTDAVTFDLSLQ